MLGLMLGAHVALPQYLGLRAVNFRGPRFLGPTSSGEYELEYEFGCEFVYELEFESECEF